MTVAVLKEGESTLMIVKQKLVMAMKDDLREIIVACLTYLVAKKVSDKDSMGMWRNLNVAE